jgi:hypothetical protein
MRILRAALCSIVAIFIACTAADASAQTQPVNGVCGSANGVPTSGWPADGFCLAGSSAYRWSEGARFNWTCAGLDGGANASCSAPLLAAGQCGSTLDACAAGDYAGDQSNDDMNYYWTCSGLNGGLTSPQCALPITYNCAAQAYSWAGNAYWGPGVDSNATDNLPNGLLNAVYPAAGTYLSGYCGKVPGLLYYYQCTSAGWAWQFVGEADSWKTCVSQQP